MFAYTTIMELFELCGVCFIVYTSSIDSVRALY